MFPYSFGVQAPTKEKAMSDLAAQMDKLAKLHPEKAERYSAHLKAVEAAAGVMVDVLPEDDEDEPTDVAVSAHGHLVAKKNVDPEKPDDVQSATFSVFAQRRPTDASKHAKPEKPEKKGFFDKKQKHPESPSGSVIVGTDGAIIDAAGNSWSITAAGQVAVNLSTDATTKNVIGLAYVNGLVWQENSAHVWSSKTSPAAPWVVGVKPVIPAPTASK